jgi:hypothetical protein
LSHIERWSTFPINEPRKPWSPVGLSFIPSKVLFKKFRLAEWSPSSTAFT